MIAAAGGVASGEERRTRARWGPAAPLALGLFSWISACTEDRNLILPWPGAATSVVAVSTAGDRPLRLVAADLSDGPSAVGWDLPTDQAVDRVWLFAYDRSLSALGLKAGELPPGADADPLLPRPDRAYWNSVAVDAPAEWAQTQDPPPFRVGTPLDPCGTLEVELAELPGTEVEQMASVVLLDPDTALIGTLPGRLFEVESSGRVRERVGTSTRALHLAAYLGPDGELTVLDVLGGIWRGPIGAPILEVDGPTGPRRYLDSGNVVGWGEERWVVHASRRWLYFDGQAWQQLYDGPPTDDNVDAIALGPGEALATGLLPGVVHHFRAGRVELERFSDDAVELGTNFLQHPRLGLYLGTSQGELYRRDDRGWTWIGTSALGRTITAMGAFPESIYVSGAEGVGVEFVPSFGSCSVDRRTPGITERIVTLGDRLLVVSRKCCDRTGNETPALLRRSRP